MFVVSHFIHVSSCMSNVTVGAVVPFLFVYPTFVVKGNKE
jgi:hypothetical protein